LNNEYTSLCNLCIDEALLQVAQIQQLNSATQKEFSALRKQIDAVEEKVHITGTNGVAHFEAQERRAWANAFDLVSLNPRDQPSLLEKALHWLLRHIFQPLWGRFKACFVCFKLPLYATTENPLNMVIDPDAEREKYQEDFFRNKRAVHRTSGVIFNAFAASIPGLCVLALYHLKDIKDRIYLLIGLAVAFAIIVRLTENNKDVEIFGVSAA
jgi:hypothetical protein